MDNWTKILKKIIKFRKTIKAPVDTCGPYIIPDKTKGVKTYRYQVFVTIFLSSSTKDIVTCKAIKSLQDQELTVDKISKTKLSELKKLLYPVGYYNQKAAQLKAITNILIKDHNSDIPKTYDGLIKLPGIGPKMATLIMNIAYKQNCGISVDTHVHRILNRLGVVDTKTPIETKEDIEDITDEKYYIDVNKALVGFGQTICQPRNPKCELCPVKNICEYYKIK
jgi:endonuclease-3